MSIEFRELYKRPEEGSKNKLVVVTGISGSGKDYLLSEFAKTDDRIGKTISVVNFGELLFSRLRQVDPGNNIVKSRDDLNRSVSQDVIRVLINSVVDEVIARQPAIVNAHVAYKQQGSIQINPDVVRRMAVTNFVYVWSDPELIAEWRKNDHDRRRDPEAPEDIIRHQRIALESTRIIAEALGSGFRSLYNRTDNIIENISKLQEVVEDINVK